MPIFAPVERPLEVGASLGGEDEDDDEAGATLDCVFTCELDEEGVAVGVNGTLIL